jgi:hypothetical protein
MEDERKFFQFSEQSLLINEYDYLESAIEEIADIFKNNKISGKIEEYEDIIEEMLDKCGQSYTRIKELLPVVNYRRMTQLPTPSPSANLMINLAVCYNNGTATKEMFEEAVRKSEQDFNLLRAKFNILTKQQLDNRDLIAEIINIQKGIQLFQEAFNGYYDFFQTERLDKLIKSEKCLREGAKILDKSCRFFDELVDREGKTPCVRCGKYNQPDRKTCESCGAILAKMGDGRAASTFGLQEGRTTDTGDTEDDTLPENLEKMFIAVNQVDEGEITPEEFEEVVDWMQELIDRTKITGALQIPHVDTTGLSPTQMKNICKLTIRTEEARDIFCEGYEDWEEGLEYFREFMDTGDKNFLVKGVQIMADGNSRLNQVKKLTQSIMDDLDRMETETETETVIETEFESGLDSPVDQGLG